jgi:hypothetical protein
MIGVLPLFVPNLASNIMFHLWMILVVTPSFFQLCVRVMFMIFLLNFHLMLNAFLTQKSSVFNLAGEANIAHSINIFNKMAILTYYLVFIPINKMGLLKENIDILSKLD